MEHTIYLSSKLILQMKQIEFQRIRDLLESEQEPFSKFLEYQTCPLVDGIDMKDQDFYYKHDYERWKEQVLKMRYRRGFVK